MSQSTYKSLLKELRLNNVRKFREIVDTEGLPQDRNCYDYELLMRALRLNRKRIVNYLLDKRCRVNKPHHPNCKSNTPLHLAAGKLGWCSIVEKMLKLKACVTDVNADGNTPLHVAFINHLSDHVINLLLKHYLNESTVDIRNKDGLGFMHIACMEADRWSVQKFFDVGMSDIYSQVSSDSDSIYAGYSCLHFAVEAGNHDIVKCLCKAKADVCIPDNNDSTPLHLALERHDVQMIDILFEYDDKYENCTNERGLSHFMAACAGTDGEIPGNFIENVEKDRASYDKLLNERVKDIPDYQFAGYTGLHFACEHGRYSTIAGLVIGCDFHFNLTTQKLSPLDLARKNNHAKACKVLRLHCDHCESCNDLVLANEKPEVVIEMKKSVMNDDQCLAAVKAMKGNGVFGFSRDRIIFFARTFVIANFPRFIQKWATKLINYIMGPKKDCEFCQYFNCHRSQPRVDVKLGAGLFGN